MSSNRLRTKFGADRGTILAHNAHIEDWIIERVLALGIVRAPNLSEATVGGAFDATAMPRVLNKRNLTGRGNPGKYIGRPSLLGNEFQIGRDGNRRQVIEKYLDQLERNQSMIEHAFLLGTHSCICWCDPLPCHGHPLLLIANWPRLRRE
jgi:hypothetical protein